MSTTAVLVGVVGMASLALAGCTRPETEAVVVLPIVPKCPNWACPELDAIVSSIPVHVLLSNGQPNPDEMAMIFAMGPDATPVDIVVAGDRMHAVQLLPPYQVFEGEALAGVTFWLQHQGNEVFELVVDKVRSQSLTLWVGTPEPVEAYEIRARRVSPPDPSGEAAYICSGASTETDPRWGGVPHAAIAFHGDYFDLDQATILPPPSPAQFHLACPGTGMAAAHLSRHTNASNHDGAFPTTHDQRVTMFKMQSADYCGTGQSFTGDNYPVRWLDNTGWSQPPLDLDPQHGEITSIEAIWGPAGAVCLDTPRMYPREKIPCALPACGDIPGWASQGHIISANPVLSP